MSLYIAAVSSMNHFFLRKVKNKPGNKVEVINEELQNYLMALNSEDPLDQDIEEVIENEIEEGEYFTDMTEQQARYLLETAITELVGGELPSVVEFYISLAKRRSLLKEVWR